MQDAKIAKKNRHLRTIAQICPAISSQLRHVSTTGEKLLDHIISSTCLHNMVNFDPLTADIGSRVWGKFQGVSRLGFLTAAMSLSGGQTNFAQCLAVSYAGTLYIHFGGLLLLTKFCPVQSSLYVHVQPSLAFSYIGNVTARQSSSGRQPNFAA